MSSFEKQECPNYIFRGSNTHQNVTLAKLFFDFPLQEIVRAQDIFFDNVKSVYFQEKHLNPIDDKPRLMDLSKVKNVAAADFHLKVYAITGLPELGTSNTESIPYCDRQSVEVALKHHFGDMGARCMQESDVENINALRLFLAILAPKYSYASMTKSNIGMLQERKKNFTRTDISPLIQRQHDAWLEIFENYHRVLIAKIKHIMFLADRISDRDVRMATLREVEEHIASTGISTDDLSIDLGVDGGITSDTYRPAYQIKMLPQLNHLGVDEISIPEERVIEWSFNLQRKSLQRIVGTVSFLEEPSEYLLDWKF